MLLETIHKLIDIAVDKGHTEPQRREDITNAIYRASVMMFKEKDKMYGRNSIITAELRPFIVYEPDWTLSQNLPAGFHRHVYLATIDHKPIDVLSEMEWADRVNNSISGPSDKYPIGIIEGGKIVVRPDSITKVALKYLNNPVVPVYATTVVNNEEVFDLGNSTDVEWGDEMLPELLSDTLSFLGISLRAEDVIQYSEMQSAKQ